MTIHLKVFILCFFFSLTFASKTIITPVLYGIYNSEGDLWKYNKSYSSLCGWGILGIYNKDKLSIKLDFYNNRIYNISHRPNFFNDEQGLSRFKRTYIDDSSPTAFDFDISNLKINYKYNDLNLYLGKFNAHWGYGNSSLTISNKSPSFPKFGFNLKLNKHINFEYFHGSLKSNILDTTVKDFYVHDIPFGNRSPNLNRFLAAHRLIIAVNQNLDISLNELVIYGVRNIDIHYCLPFLPFWSLQGYLGDLDNIIMSMDFNYKLNEQKSIYGSILIDEIRPSKIFSNNNRNWFGYQLGLKFSNIIFNNDNFISELNWTDHRIYRHRYEINDFYNHNYPIGFWGGPHSQQIYLNYSFTKFNLFFNFDYSDSKRGVLTDAMLDNQYLNNEFLRFQDGYEIIESFKISIQKHLFKGISSLVGINFINWQNANFDIDGLNNQNLINVNKTSFLIGISYNYDFKKQETFLNKDSYKYIIN